jgi:hypothetical protein
MTQSRARRKAAPTPPQPQPSYPHEAGGSSWHSASTDGWGWQAPARRSTSSSSSSFPHHARCTASTRDFSSITQQLGELKVQANDIEESLHQHIQTNQACSDTGERIHAMEQRQLQQQEEWRAYLCCRGYNPNQQQCA